jgi:dolichol-phosphate mannosyltransferase
MNKSVVLIPTYNEAASIAALLIELTDIAVDVIVIDDDSPDLTAIIVKNLEMPHVRVIDHGKKGGIGPAYVLAMQESVESKYEKIATMDADGSHLVSDLSAMLDSSQDADVVMGTRWIPGASVSNWSFGRKRLSKFGTWYARKCLALPYKDLTGGLRVYDRRMLEMIDLDTIKSNGYCFQIEMINRLHLGGAKIKEVPIHFIERHGGVSKMSRSIVIEAFKRVSIWGFQRLIGINADKLHYVK